VPVVGPGWHHNGRWTVDLQVSRLMPALGEKMGWRRWLVRWEWQRVSWWSDVCLFVYFGKQQWKLARRPEDI
jgi:hypothetical protein